MPPVVDSTDVDVSPKMSTVQGYVLLYLTTIFWAIIEHVRVMMTLLFSINRGLSHVVHYRLGTGNLSSCSQTIHNQQHSAAFCN